MSAGIDKTLELLSSVQDLAVRVIGDAKTKSFLSLLADLPQVFSDVSTLMQDAPAVFPELSDLDAVEVGQLGTKAYGLVVAVIHAVL